MGAEAVEQWVQRTSGTVGTEDQWNSGYRGPVEQWVQIQAPYENKNDFVNRKGSHSINVQAICNHKGR